MIDESTYRMIDKMDDAALITELQFISAVHSIPNYPDLVLIDYINDVEMAVHERVAQRFMELHTQS